MDTHPNKKILCMLFHKTPRMMNLSTFWSLMFGVCIYFLSYQAFGDNERDFNNKLEHLVSWLWGTPVPSQVNFFPIGTHFLHTNRVNNKQWLVGGVYRGIAAGTFINSFNRRVFYQGFNRQIYRNNLFNLSYLFGVMEGYGNEFKNYFGPILGHDPGPLVALKLDLRLSEHLSIDITTYGVGILGGISYIF
ncbi:hypothetical protein [Legionella sp. WA2024007413]